MSAENTIISCFRGRSVLITGGLGFIGSHLARRLVAAGARVTLVDSLMPEYGGNWFNIRDIRDEVTANICDVRDPYAMSYLVQRQDFLFNLAGQTSHLDSMDDPYTDLAINAQAQLSILEACRKYNKNIKLVFSSTRQIYGTPEYLPVDETHPICPVDINGINKFAGEWYHLVYHRVHGIRACALRLTNTFGPGMRVKDARQTFLGVWIRNLIEGKPILVFGDGMQLRDFNFVDDCVEAMLIAGSSDKANGQVFNLGSNDKIRLKDLASLITNLGIKGDYELVPFPTERKKIDIGDYYGDFSRIRTQLGWKPRISLREGLSATVAYYQKHHSHYWP
jgi:UDP-glucose 4-epimerase